MALIVEDGTIVAGANGFCTVADVRQFAEDRGFELPTDDVQVEQFIVQSTDFICTLEECFQGVRVDINQELSFPRDGVEVYEKDLSGTIPNLLKKATARLAYDAANGIDLQPTTTGQLIIEEGVGPLRVKYADHSRTTGSVDAKTTFNAAIKLLTPLFKTNKQNGSGFNIPVCR